MSGLCAPFAGIKMTIPDNDIEFAELLRRQAIAVFSACEEPVARDLSASLTAAADRIIDLSRRAYLNSPHSGRDGA